MLVSCMGLSVGAELAHRRLCDHYWSTRRWIPLETLAFAELTKTPPESVPALLLELASVGWHPQAKTLVNMDARTVLHEALTAQSRASSKARHAALARWSEPTAPASEKHPGKLDAPRIAPALPAALPPAVPPQCHNSTVQNSTVQAVNAERLTRSVSPREKGAGDEKAFFEHLESVLKPTGARQAALELENWGGWWRNRFRENPGKARRVVADVATMLKEGRVTKGFGAAAVDLWGRLPAQPSRDKSIK